MKKEIIDWYSNNHYHPDKVVRVGIERFGLSEPKVLAAMEHCYHKIHNGKKIPMIDVARYVFNVSKNINASDYKEKLKLIEYAEDKISSAEQQAYKYMLVMKNERELSKNLKDKIRNLKTTSCLSFIFIGFINLLIWLFILNWN